jgi:hypothetical protein
MSSSLTELKLPPSYTKVVLKRDKSFMKKIYAAWYIVSETYPTDSNSQIVADSNYSHYTLTFTVSESDINIGNFIKLLNDITSMHIESVRYCVSSPRIEIVVATTNSVESQSSAKKVRPKAAHPFESMFIKPNEVKGMEILKSLDLQRFHLGRAVGDLLKKLQRDYYYYCQVIEAEVTYKDTPFLIVKGFSDRIDLQSVAGCLNLSKKKVKSAKLYWKTGVLEFELSMDEPALSNRYPAHMAITDAMVSRKRSHQDMQRDDDHDDDDYAENNPEDYVPLKKRRMDGGGGGDSSFFASQTQ